MIGAYFYLLEGLSLKLRKGTRSYAIYRCWASLIVGFEPMDSSITYLGASKQRLSVELASNWLIGLHPSIYIHISLRKSSIISRLKHNILLYSVLHRRIIVT